MRGKNSKLINILPHQFVFTECKSSTPTHFQMVPNFTPIHQVFGDTETLFLSYALLTATQLYSLLFHIPGTRLHESWHTYSGV